jgi:hypothetical protein
VRLIDELTERLAGEPSLFRAQLLREDIARLRRLEDLARTSQDAEAYRRAGRRLGWTALAARTHELGGALDRLLDAVRDGALGNGEEDAHARASDAWLELTRERMERMIGCLSTPVPKPTD